MMKITTESRKVYNINRRNQIFATGQIPSDAWTLKFFVDRYGKIVNPTEGYHRFENGHGSVWVIDNSHGTTRKWKDRVVRVEYEADMDDLMVL